MSHCSECPYVLKETPSNKSYENIAHWLQMGQFSNPSAGQPNETKSRPQVPLLEENCLPGPARTRQDPPRTLPPGENRRGSRAWLVPVLVRLLVRLHGLGGVAAQVCELQEPQGAPHRRQVDIGPGVKWEGSRGINNLTIEKGVLSYWGDPTIE